MLLKYSALALFAALPAQTNAAACLNSDTFKKEVNGVPRSCVWIRFMESRRVEHCVDPEVLNACPQSCGSCCDDDPTFEFANNFDVDVDCAWISKNSKRIDVRRETWCGLTFENDVNVRDACPLACDFCFDQVSSFPSVSHAPSVSMVPTKQPSSEPSRHPSREPSREPSRSPSMEPSRDPSSSPTREPSKEPSKEPSRSPSASPTLNPTVSIEPTASPMREPSANPSSSPSREPSREPSRSPTATPSAKPSVSIMPSNAPNYLCRTTEQDDEDFLFNIDFNEFPVNCQWLTRSNGEIRQEQYCPRFEIANACRFGCQTCVCANNWNFRFELINPDLGKRNCKWITKGGNTAERRARYCFDENNKITDDIGRNCPLACGTCV